MKIDSYQVGFDVKHQGLSMDYQNINVSENKTSLANDKTTTVANIQTSRDNNELVDAKLSAKMQVSLLNKLKEVNRTVEYESLHAEYEDLSFSTKAIIKADGKELSVNLQANLKRSFVQQEKIVLNGVQFTDPLIISLDGNMPQLGNDTFSFDIDNDGTKDQISKLKYGSGFLALDKNENGKIDDGGELFGTRSGDGFRDLSAYDDDENGWIDENDKIFDKLRIWQKTDGGDKLVGIGEVGIGAIFLGSSTAQFTYKSLEDNQTQGEAKSSGFFVYEDGRAGVISQVDFAVYNQNSEANSNISKMKKILDDINKNNGKTIYDGLVGNTNSTTKQKDDDESIIEKLKAQIAKLEAKLLKADKKEMGSIQAQIGTLKIQMLSLIQMGVA